MASPSKKGVAGIPTAFIATWGSGKPVLALGSDIDGIPQASQKPGVAYHDPIIEGAPGHGEGHNSGEPLNITAALAVKKIMEREKLPGTIRIWSGMAEELVGTKAYFVRAGLFKDVDVALFTHVDNEMGVSWGDRGRQRALCQSSIRSGARPRTPLARLARAKRARRRRVDGHRLELPARTPAASNSARTTSSPTAAISPTSSRAARPSGTTSGRRPTKNQGDVGDRRFDREGRRDDDRDRAAAVARAWVTRGRSTSTSPSPKRHSPTSSGSACRNGATRIKRWPMRCRKSWVARDRAGHEAAVRSCRGPARTTPAADRTTSAISPGTCRRSRCAIRRIFPVCPGTTGRTPSRWPHRSRTRA